MSIRVYKIASIIFDTHSHANGTTVRAARITNIFETINCNAQETADLPFIVHHAGSLYLSDSQKNMLRSDKLFAKLWVFFIWHIRLIIFLLCNKYDIVYDCNDWLGFLPVYLLAKVKKYSILFDAHSIFSEENAERGKKGKYLKYCMTWEKFVIKNSNFIMACSPNTMEFYRKFNHNIELISVFVNIEHRPRFESLNKDVKLLGLIGPFESVAANKGFLDFVYKNLDQFDVKVRHVIIGECSRRLDDCRLSYTGHIKSFDDYIAQLLRLDTVIVPANIATSGPLNKIIEAMSCGLPVFTTPKGMVGLFWITPGTDILVFDEENLVSKINELIFDEELMTAIGKNAKKVVDDNYSERVNRKKIIQILHIIRDSNRKYHNVP